MRKTAREHSAVEKPHIPRKRAQLSVDESWLSQQPHDQGSGGNLSQKLAAAEKE
jgi:hypothetical protein